MTFLIFTYCDVAGSVGLRCSVVYLCDATGGGDCGVLLWCLPVMMLQVVATCDVVVFNSVMLQVMVTSDAPVFTCNVLMFICSDVTGNGDG